MKWINWFDLCISHVYLLKANYNLKIPLHYTKKNPTVNVEKMGETAETKGEGSLPQDGKCVTSVMTNSTTNTFETHT